MGHPNRRCHRGQPTQLRVSILLILDQLLSKMSGLFWPCLRRGAQPNRCQLPCQRLFNIFQTLIGGRPVPASS